VTDKFPIPPLFFALTKPFEELDIRVNSIVLEPSSITWRVGELFAKVTERHPLFEVSMGVAPLDWLTHNQVCETESEAYTIIITWLKEQQ
jgi:hypothetical protein